MVEYPSRSNFVYFYAQIEYSSRCVCKWHVKVSFCFLSGGPVVPKALMSEHLAKARYHVGLSRPCQPRGTSHYAVHHAFFTPGRQALSMAVYLSLDIRFSQNINSVLIFFRT